MRKCPKNKKGGGNLAIELNLRQLLHQTRLHLEEPLLVLAEGQTNTMQSLAAKRKITLYMLSQV